MSNTRIYLRQCIQNVLTADRAKAEHAAMQKRFEQQQQRRSVISAFAAAVRLPAGERA